MKLAASYLRVSTEEQALHGYSIQAQREAIAAYAAAHGYKIVHEYADEGVSGKKPYTKRPALSRFMQDIQSGLKPDALLFTKLDRLFRSVKHYYKAAEVLDANGIPWIAIHEDYETETANGRLKVNMMLSIAEHEADRTAERIKAVNVSKVQHGQAVTGAVPYGYRIENHRVLIDPEKAPLVRELFRFYRERNSMVASVRWIKEKYGRGFSKQWARNTLSNRLYIGEYRGNAAYCEPLIGKEEFAEVQRLLKERGVTQTKTRRVYLFTGLLRCAECGGSLSIVTSSAGAYYYRCYKHSIHPDVCPHKKHLSEDALEKWLLLNVKSQLDAETVRIRVECERIKKDIPDKAGILRKLERIKAAYLSEVIPLDVFQADYESLTAQLAEIERQEREEPKEPDFQRTRERLTALDGAYQEMDRQGKQNFWRGIIEKIVVDRENNVTIYFL